MVSLESGEPLFLYVTATTEAMSMVLVAERPEPSQPQETKETSTDGSGSQDSEPARSPKVGVTAGSQLAEASLAPERQEKLDNATGSQPLEVNSGPSDLKATMPPLRHF
jgi:hypothetical protein